MNNLMKLGNTLRVLRLFVRNYNHLDYEELEVLEKLSLHIIRKCKRVKIVNKNLKEVSFSGKVVSIKLDCHLMSNLELDLAKLEKVSIRNNNLTQIDTNRTLPFLLSVRQPMPNVFDHMKMTFNLAYSLPIHVYRLDTDFNSFYRLKGMVNNTRIINIQPTKYYRNKDRHCNVVNAGDDVQFVVLLDVLSSCTKLRQLSFRSCHFAFRSKEVITLDKEIEPIKCKSLKLVNCHGDRIVLCTLLQLFPRLERLWCNQQNSIYLERHVEYLTKLKSLTVVNTRNACYNMLKSLKYLTLLESHSNVLVGNNKVAIDSASIEELEIYHSLRRVYNISLYNVIGGVIHTPNLVRYSQKVVSFKDENTDLILENVQKLGKLEYFRVMHAKTISRFNIQENAIGRIKRFLSAILLCVTSSKLPNLKVLEIAFARDFFLFSSSYDDDVHEIFSFVDRINKEYIPMFKKVNVQFIFHHCVT